MPIDRSAIARLENGKRGVSLEEAMRLAFVLHVAPVHLLVDPDSDEPLAPVVGHEVEPWAARAWIRGERPMMGQDPRFYFTNIPLHEFEEQQRTGRTHVTPVKPS